MIPVLFVQVLPDKSKHYLAQHADFGLLFSTQKDQALCFEIDTAVQQKNYIKVGNKYISYQGEYVLTDNIDDALYVYFPENRSYSINENIANYLYTDRSGKEELVFVSPANTFLLVPTNGATKLASIQEEEIHEKRQEPNSNFRHTGIAAAILIFLLIVLAIAIGIAISM